MDDLAAASTHVGCDRLQLERVTSRAGLVALRPEWDSLWASLPHRIPFLHSGWMYAWWDTFGTGELRVLVFRQNTRVVAIIPLYLSRAADGIGELRFVGGGVSDYLDLLVIPDAVFPVLEAFELVLESWPDEWTFCAFDHLPPDSALLQMHTPPGTLDTRAADEPCLILRLPPSTDRLPEAIGSRMAKNIRYQRRRAEQIGDITVQHASSQTVAHALDTLFCLHQMRWQQSGGGMLADSAVRAFHRAAAPALLNAGTLRLHVLRIGGQAAAAYFGFHVAGREYFYISGFDPQFASVSAGTLSLTVAIERAVTEGASTFNFLSGAEPYKYHWKAADHPRISRYLRRSCREGIA